MTAMMISFDLQSHSGQESWALLSSEEMPVKGVARESGYTSTRKDTLRQSIPSWPDVLYPLVLDFCGVRTFDRSK